MKIRYIVIIIILSIIIISLFIFLLFFYFIPLSVIDEANIKQELQLPFPGDYNLLQTMNDCGPYNCAIVVHVLKQVDVDVKEYISQMEHRRPDGMTLPVGLEELLRKKGITVETAFLFLLNNKQKIQYLKSQLSRSKAIILLGKKWEIGHFIVILGYNENSFYIYDSWHTRDYTKPGLYTVDDNGPLPGNRTLSNQQLLEFWGGMKLAGFAFWYALVASG
jgi:hypothetical protein